MILAERITEIHSIPNILSLPYVRCKPFLKSNKCNRGWGQLSSNRYVILTHKQPEESITIAKLSANQYVYKKFRNASVILKNSSHFKKSILFSFYDFIKSYNL